MPAWVVLAESGAALVLVYAAGVLLREYALNRPRRRIREDAEALLRATIRNYGIDHLRSRAMAADLHEIAFAEQGEANGDHAIPSVKRWMMDVALRELLDADRIEFSRSTRKRGDHSARFGRKPPAAPPKFAEFVLDLIPGEKAQERAGDLAERFPRMQAKYGDFWARAWYCSQVGSTFFPLIKLALVLRTLGAVAEWIRKVIQ